MSIQPVGYNLPTFANITAYIPFSPDSSAELTSTASAIEWISILRYAESIGSDDRSTRNDCYEVFTGRINEIMHHRSHQSDY